MASILERVRQNRDEVRKEAEAERFKREAILAAVEQRSGKEMTATEQRDFDRSIKHSQTLNDELVEFGDRVDELVIEESRAAASAETYRMLNGTSSPYGTLATVTRENGTYARHKRDTSYFLDLADVRKGSRDALDRLQQNNREREVDGHESRALGNTGATGGSGGEFAPPVWFIDDFVALARPGRVLANLIPTDPLPTGVSSINLPKVTGGTVTAVQTTQNTALANTDMTTASVSSKITTIGGKQTISRQLIDQSGIPFDKYILADLAADYARQLNTQVISGSGTGQQLRGLLTVAGSSATFTSASPTVAALYSKMSGLQSAINTARFLPMDTWVMHPQRWAWLVAAVDSSSRPLVVPQDNGYSVNAVAGIVGNPPAVGRVGTMLGYPVYVDATIPTNTGAGSNQDTIFALRTADLQLYESPLQCESFEQTYADSLAILVRCFAYSAFIPDRYAASVGTITGTGLITPVF
jgi:HK97 family phage major capsid protein